MPGVTGREGGGVQVSAGLETGIDRMLDDVPDTRSEALRAESNQSAAAFPSDDQSLRRDHLRKGLGRRTISGGVVTGVAQALQAGLNIATIAVLARLLSPQDFGLVAMASAILAFLAIFREAGLFTATVQKGDLTHQHVSNLFWANAGLGLFAASVTALLSPFVAEFYRDERLVGILLALSVTFVLAGFTVQHEALLVRQMRFRTRALIQLTSLVCGVVTASILAYMGYGYWSLVCMQLTSGGVLLTLAWASSGWRPGLPGREYGTASLLRFGVHLTLGSTIASFCAGSDSFVLGRLFGAEAVGFYSRGQVLLRRPLDQILSPLGAVLLPGLSVLQNDPEHYRRVFSRVLDIVMIVCFPFAAVICALAEPFVIVLLGHRWLSTAPVFIAFSFAGIYIPLCHASGWLMESQGRGRDALRANTSWGLLTLTAVLIGSSWGPVGVALTMSLMGLVAGLPVIFYFAGSKGPVRTADLWTSLLRHVPSWLATFGVATAIRLWVTDVHPIIEVLFAAPAGVLAGVGVAMASKSFRSSAVYFLHLVLSAPKAS